VYSFVQHLNTKSKLFQGKLDTIVLFINDFIITPVASSLDNEMEKLNTYDFSTFSDSEYGEIFSEICIKTIITDRRITHFYTTDKLSNLIGKVIAKEKLDGSVLYNPGSGISSISTYLSRTVSNDFQFHGEEMNQNIYVLGLMNLICNGIKINNFQNDSVADQDNKAFADIVVSEPPYGARVPLNAFEDKYPVRTKEMVLVFIQRALEALKEGGTAAIFVPESVLFSSQRDFSNLRKYLIDNHFLEAIVSLPAGIMQPVSTICIYKSLLFVFNR
jgi:tRNA1(Val) A37 N6-methylase TrmN6